MSARLSGTSSKKNPVKVWGKRLEAVDPAARGGLAFLGEWLPKDGQRVSAEGGIVVFCAERTAKTYWVVDTAPTEAIPRCSDWNGEVDGQGRILYMGDSAHTAVEAAVAAGVPVRSGAAPAAVNPRAVGAAGRGRPCGYTGQWRPSEAGLCPHCGDDC